VIVEPTPTPTPTPAPELAPDPGPPAAVVAGPPTPGSGEVTTKVRALRFLRPFPVVRIRGFLARGGARVTLLTVRAPRRATITVRCRGRGCPRLPLARSTRLVHLRRYERLLRAGVQLEISVTRPGYVGKHTVLRMRRGKAPLRRDLCIFPGARQPRSCAST
jgi:hypothetical protein